MEFHAFLNRFIGNSKELSGYERISGPIRDPDAVCFAATQMSSKKTIPCFFGRIRFQSPHDGTGLQRRAKPPLTNTVRHYVAERLCRSIAWHRGCSNKG